MCLHLSRFLENAGALLVLCIRNDGILFDGNYRYSIQFYFAFYDLISCLLLFK